MSEGYNSLPRNVIISELTNFGLSVNGSLYELRQLLYDYTYERLRVYARYLLLQKPTTAAPEAKNTVAPSHTISALNATEFDLACEVEVDHVVAPCSAATLSVTTDLEPPHKAVLHTPSLPMQWTRFLW